MKIELYYLDIDQSIRFKPVFKKLLSEIFKAELKVPGTIAVILTNNRNILQINRDFLNHHYYTDVITFPERKRSRISGDIYVSVDQVKENSAKFDTSFMDELTRVIIHGILHLIGYEDVTNVQKNQMREKEDNYLCRFKKHDFIAL